MAYETSIKVRPMSAERNLDVLARCGINKHYGDAQTAQNITGSYHTTVCTLDKKSSIHVGVGVTEVGDATIEDFNDASQWSGLYPYTNQFASRGWGSVVKTQFNTNSDYILIDLDSAEDWTASNADDDNLLFWLGGEQTLAGTILDIELLSSASASVSDHGVTAYATANQWQLINIDVSGDTLSDVQYIKIQCDTATGDPTIYISDFVRTHADTLTNDYYKLLTDNSVLGCPADFVEAYITNTTADDTFHLHLNSLANSPYTVHNGYPRYVGDPSKFQPVYALWIHGATDTSSKIWIETEGRYL